ncbi:MAG: hypothetical protein AAF724_13665 [Pseudomonadota bacterium]
MLRTSVLALALLVGAATQSSAENLACEDHSLFMSNNEILFIGEQTVGAQPGDRRILDWRVHDAEGNDLGTFHVVTTVLSDTDDGHLITATGSVVLANGEVHATITTELPDASSDTRSSAGAVEWAITGGTDTFTHASGTLVTGPPQDALQSLDDWSFNLTMECEE